MQAGPSDVTLEGLHAVKHALRFAPELVTEVRAVSVEAALALAHALAPDVVAALRERLVEGPAEHPTGVVGTALRPVEDRTALERRTAPLVVLDGVRHAGNAGAVVRVAAAASASGVVVDGDLDPWHPTVLRGSAGLHYALPVLRARIEEVSGPVLVLDADGDPLGRVPDDAVLVVGSERVGVGPRARARADGVVSLPMRDGVSSLNLATAVAAVLYRWRLDDPHHLSPGGTLLPG